MAKIAENCDHNIEPWPDSASLIMRCKMIWQQQQKSNWLSLTMGPIFLAIIFRREWFSLERKFRKINPGVHFLIC
jgi:hypothetical protein